jgi:hypothetical protein
VGLFVVLKSGGEVRTVDNQTAAASIAPSGSAMVVAGGSASGPRNGIFVIRRDGTNVRVLVDDATIASGVRVFDGNAYYLTEGEEGNLLWSVRIVDGTPVLVRDDVTPINDFEVDECAITIGTNRGTLERIKR